MSFDTNTLQQIASAVNRIGRLQLDQCMDAANPTSRPTPAQQQILDDLETIQFRWVVASNQAGKSTVGAREITWIFTERHPKWQRPAAWGKEPLLLIAVAGSMKQVEENLMRKIQGLLAPSEYRVVKAGNQVQKLVHQNGNTILFASHHSSEEARDKLQGFVAHYLWLDEMPSSVRLVEELQMRVRSRNGYFLATFTPKVRNDEIRQLVETSVAPVGKKYKVLVFDNPLYTKEMLSALVQSYDTFPETYRKAVLYGDWYGGECSVFDFNYEKHVGLPETYSTSWRHVLTVDPAMTKAGYLVCAEDPVTGVWYATRSGYVENRKAPSEIVQAFEATVRGVNLVRRIMDPHERWFWGEAAKMGFKYLNCLEKQDRKAELIANLQQALHRGLFKVAPAATDLIDELMSAHWSETKEGCIAGATKLHTLDCAQYFVDLRPARTDPNVFNQTHGQWLHEAHRKRQKLEAKAAKTWKAKRRGYSVWR